MKEKNWMKTIFTAYRSIDKVLKAIDNQVLSESLSSTSTYGMEDTLILADKVLNTIHRKRKLCVLKYLTEESLKNIKEEYAKILMFKFFDNFSEEEICAILKLAPRTLHRKILAGLRDCYIFFAKNGCDTKALEKCFGTERFIQGIYSNIVEKTKSKTKKPAEDKPICLSANLDFRNYVSS